METCQAIPSILSCFWPALHPKDTARVNVLWLSSLPPSQTKSSHFCHTSESVELGFEIESKATETLAQLFFRKAIR